MKLKSLLSLLLSASTLIALLCSCNTTDEVTTAPLGSTEAATETEKTYEDIGGGKFSVAEDTVYLTVGDECALTPQFDFDAGQVEYTYLYDDKYFAYEDGVLKAVAAGDTTLTIKDEKYGCTASAKAVIVSNLRDNIIISVPVWRAKWATEEQLKYMDDAGVDLVVAVSGIETADYKTSVKLLETAMSTWGGGTGVRVLAHSTELLSSPDFSDEKIIALCKKYSAYKAFAGFHINDEPFDMNPFGKVAGRFYTALSGHIYDSNFLPGGCYPSYSEYYDRMCDYAALAGADSTYISFDNYPFGPVAGSVDEVSLFGNLNAERLAGLKTNTPTAFYLQAVGGFNNSYRRPDEAQLNYHVGCALAYGIKWIKYWSWFVPDYGSDPEQTTYKDYTDAIIGKDGLPTSDLYPAAQTLHSKVHTLGGTLVNLEAVEVYHTGSKSAALSVYEKLPGSFFVQPSDKRSYAILSLMQNADGRQYLMIVNKSSTSQQTIGFTGAFSGIREISGVDGSYKDISVTDGVWNVTLDAGGFALFELPEGDFRLNKPTQTDNLASGAYVYASDSIFSAGQCVNALTDSARVSDKSSYGWRAAAGSSVTFDLGAEKTFNRIDLYPAGAGQASGVSFPTGVNVLVSSDGLNYTEAFSSKLSNPEYYGAKLTLDKRTARYVKLVFSGSLYVELAEIEIYDNGSSVADPTKTSYEPVVQTPGVNYALYKNAIVCGSGYESAVDKWGTAYLTDGSKLQTEADGTNGWMSIGAANRTDPLWAAIDLGGYYDIDRVIVYPRQNGGYFPSDYNVLVSDNGEDWTTVAEIRGDKETGGVGRTIDFDTVKCRFVKFESAKLTGSIVDFLSGYCMQLSEIEVYKR